MGRGHPPEFCIFDDNKSSPESGLRKGGYFPGSVLKEFKNATGQMRVL
jgi:hypothetical protein